MTQRQGLPDPESQLPRMSLSQHLIELRSRVVISLLAIAAAMIGTFFIYKELLEFLMQPFYEAATSQGLTDQRLGALDTGEGFLEVLKVCFIAGVVASSPIVLWQMWGFIAAGLYAHERRTVRIFFPVSLALFALGLVAAYILLIPFGLRFLIAWNVELGFRTEFRVSSYLSTCMTMLFSMGFVFQLPLVMLFLTASDIVSRETWRKGWRIAVVVAFFLGMILTDPSPVTQIMMAVPIIGLYFLGIWGGRFVGEKAERFRIWKAWPLVLALVVFALMLIYADVLNDLAAGMFGGEARPAPTGDKGGAG